MVIGDVMVVRNVARLLESYSMGGDPKGSPVAMLNIRTALGERRADTSPHNARRSVPQLEKRVILIPPTRCVESGDRRRDGRSVAWV